jgi:hypothetical protein
LRIIVFRDQARSGVLAGVFRHGSLGANLVAL